MEGKGDLIKALIDASKAAPKVKATPKTIVSTNIDTSRA